MEVHNELSNNPVVSLKDIEVSFDGEVILDKLNLDIEHEEFITLLGPSGCGKTTTLRIIGGFLQPDSGEIYFDGECGCYKYCYKDCIACSGKEIDQYHMNCLTCDTSKGYTYFKKIREAF